MITKILPKEKIIMKKNIIIAACILICCSLYGCSSEKTNEASVTASQETVSEPEVSETEETTAVSETITEPVTEVTTAEAESETDADKFRSPDGFPVLDGSTSAIPLDAAIRAAYTGQYTAEEIEPFIVHSKTYQSFVNLTEGSVDGIYTVPLSPQQKQLAEEKNFKYESVPVAKEGFVFLVNASNPVDSLTQDQLRKIFSGEIRNWSEVGGNDEEINIFIRNDNSGSGSYFSEFMGDTPAADGEYVYKLGSMGGVIAELASYDNGPAAIGFSVFSYVAEMNSDNTDIKMIAVDGIPADRENIKNDSYPLLSSTYFMYSADEPEDSEVRKVAEFITSEKGQDAVESVGYIRVS